MLFYLRVLFIMKTVFNHNKTITYNTFFLFSLEYPVEDVRSSYIYIIFNNIYITRYYKLPIWRLNIHKIMYFTLLITLHLFFFYIFIFF